MGQGVTDLLMSRAGGLPDCGDLLGPAGLRRLRYLDELIIFAP